MPAQDNQSSLLHQQQLLVIGFLGGIAFTALVLILQEQRTFEVSEWIFSGEAYFDLLLVLVAGTSSVCIFGSLALTGIAAGIIPSQRMRTFAGACFLGGLAGLLTTLPLLVLIFSRAGALIVFGFELLLTVSFLYSFGEGNNKRDA